MKEAAGEANLTVITIVLIALVLGVGTVIVNSALNSTGKSSACATAGGYWKGNVCYTDDTLASQYTCTKLGKNETKPGCDKGEYCCY